MVNRQANPTVPDDLDQVVIVFRTSLVHLILPKWDRQQTGFFNGSWHLLNIF
jgi:hypothetical protein